MEVLSHFVRAETAPIPDDGSDPPVSFLKHALIDGSWRYVCYPASLERELEGGITRVWARKVLEDLEAQGILSHVMLRPPRRRDDTPHYYLRRDHEAISRTIISLSGLLTDDSELFQGFRGLIDEEFVARVLHDKGHAMHRALKLWSLGAEEMEARFLALRADLDGEDVRDLRDYVLQSLRLVYDDGFDDSATASLDLHLSLPVMHPQDLDIAEVVAMNPGSLRPGEAESNRNGSLDRIRDHYCFHQRSHVILPILYLLAKSPSALLRFVGHPPVEGREVEHSFHGTDSLNDLIFELVTATIADMASFGDDSSAGSHVALRPEGRDGRGGPLMLVSDGTLDVLFDASFDTSRPRPPGRAGAKHGKPYLDVRASVSVSPYSGLSPEDILDFDRLIREMRRGRDPLLRSILESLPNRFRNVIELLGPGVHWCDGLRSDLVLYLNLSLMEMDLSVIAGRRGPGRRRGWAILDRVGGQGYPLLSSNLALMREMHPQIVRSR